MVGALSDRYLWKPKGDLLDRCRKAAARDGVTLVAWLSYAAERYLEPIPQASVLPPRQPLSLRLRGGAKQTKARTTVCIHRIPADRFCKRCD